MTFLSISLQYHEDKARVKDAMKLEKVVFCELIAMGFLRNIYNI